MQNKGGCQPTIEESEDTSSEEMEIEIPEVNENDGVLCHQCAETRIAAGAAEIEVAAVVKCEYPGCKKRLCWHCWEKCGTCEAISCENCHGNRVKCRRCYEDPEAEWSKMSYKFAENVEEENLWLRRAIRLYG